MCIKYMSLTNFDLHRLCKRMDLPFVFVLKSFVMKTETITKVRKIKRKYVKQSTLIVLELTCQLK
jgi:hypothetical protein